jgi:hypothetical protein
LLLASHQRANGNDSISSASVRPVIHAGIDFFSHFRSAFPNNNALNPPARPATFSENFFLLDLNLAWLSVSYETDHVRLKATPAVGYFMEKNYAAEPAGLRNLFEAYGGFCLSSSKNIWLDAGVLPSPVSFENGFSHLQMLYSRGLAAEFSPYYFTGIRLSVPLSQQLLLRLYALNGWQVIRETNDGKSALVNLEWSRSARHVFNLNLYAGNEGNSFAPRLRYLSEFYYTGFFNKWKVAAGVYTGWNQLEVANRVNRYQWLQGSLCLEYFFNTSLSLAFRAESFYDPDYQMLGNGFKDLVSGSACCLNYRMAPSCMLRAELRSYLYENTWRIAGMEPVGGTQSALITGFTWNF